MVTVTAVAKGSIADRIGIQTNDVLLAINGHEINDVLDYRFYLTDTAITLSFLRDGVRNEVRFRKDEYDDVGLEFETPLMDKKQCCANRCIFCFIDQLPKGLRPSLYFKDDDARLSFLHGNYITLTNLRDKDIDRIIKMRISPVNVSVHTTNPTLRCDMMKNRRAGKVLSYLDRLAEAGIRLCGQVVLCRGINDGAELDRTMQDLKRLAPHMSSVSIVPAGLTRYREGLYPLTPFTKEECRAVIDQVNRFGDACLAELGYRMFCVADEFYLKAELPLPEEAYYGDYEQIENGVGMLRSLMAEFALELDYLSDLVSDADALPPRHVSLATGKAAAPTMRYLASLLEKRLNGIKISVYEIENRFLAKKSPWQGS